MQMTCVYLTCSQFAEHSVLEGSLLLLLLSSGQPAPPFPQRPFGSFPLPNHSSETAVSGWGVGEAESRWQTRRTRSSSLCTIRALTGHWWGDHRHLRGREQLPSDQVGCGGEGGGRSGGGGMRREPLRGSWRKGGLPRPGGTHPCLGYQQGWGRPSGEQRIRREHGQHFPCPLGPWGAC